MSSFSPSSSRSATTGEANQEVCPDKLATHTGCCTSPSLTPAVHTGLRSPPVELPLDVPEEEKSPEPLAPTPPQFVQTGIVIYTFQNRRSSSLARGLVLDLIGKSDHNASDQKKNPFKNPNGVDQEPIQFN